MKKAHPLLSVAAGFLCAGGALVPPIAAHPQASPTDPRMHTVVAGYGDRHGAVNVFAPKVIDIYAGDTVRWRVGGDLEPHTVSFGPPALLRQLADQKIIPVPQRTGPRVELNPRIAFPSGAPAYGGIGFANSGVLAKGKTWSLTFTTPGAYRYYCLIHYPGMSGLVVVHPRPMAGSVYHVIAGDSMERPTDDNSAATDTFFPRRLTIHLGDTVSWTGTFHTVTFGPDRLRTDLERHLLLSRPGPGGQRSLYMNPRVTDPSGGATYDGTGFVNSGLLFLRARGGPGEFHLTFTRPGTFEYDCLLRQGMDGTITVLPSGTR